MAQRVAETRSPYDLGIGASWGLLWLGSSLGDLDTYFSAVPPPTWRWGQAPLMQILASGFMSGSTSCSHAYPKVRAAQMEVKPQGVVPTTLNTLLTNTSHSHPHPLHTHTHRVLCKLECSRVVLRTLPLATISVALPNFHRFHKSHDHEAYFWLGK